jgi:cholinesterase
VRTESGRWQKLTLIIVLSLSLATAAYAGSYSQVIVDGDSHSDNGNLYRRLGIPQPPYWQGRWSNGPVAVEGLAGNLHALLVDDAWGGATTGVGNIVDGGTETQMGNQNLPGMSTSFNATKYSFTLTTMRTALFVVCGGSNDFGTDGMTTATADQAAANVVSIVSGLRRLGARHILVCGLPDLGMAPEIASQGEQQAAWATYLSNYFNQKLVADLPAGILYYSIYALEHQIVLNPGAYGLTDVKDPCFSNGVVCAHPDQYLFWDGVHVTAHVHSILAQGFTHTVVLNPPRQEAGSKP